MNTILVVEDDVEVRELLTFTLQRAGFKTIEAESSEAAMRKLDGLLPDLIVIDWMLPGASGVDLARRLRLAQLTKDLPLMMLTARGEEADKLKGFDSGIDDYMTKPFSPRELVARLKALLRRTGVGSEGVLKAADLSLDTAGRRLSIGARYVHLGPTEFRLLEFLMRNPNRAFDRGQLLDRVWGRSVYVEERTVDVHVLRLRKALADDGHDQLIETVRGVGYRFAQPAK